MLIDLVAAARPNFMKIAPLYKALQREDWCRVRFVHTGQHYSPEMSELILRELMLPEPDVHLGIGPGTHAEQTAAVMVAYERVCRSEPPGWTVVVGDVNSTMAAALAAVKLNIPVGHLEAGLRSRDLTMPEEINRLVTDRVARLLLAPSADAVDNLLAEGCPASQVEMVGNIMIDALEMLREKIFTPDPPSDIYGVVTLHRPSNVDNVDVLNSLVRALIEVSERLPLVFPVHPRTKERLISAGLWNALRGARRIRLSEPLTYIQFMQAVARARLVITDSGGIQEETTYLGIPCLTMRTNTERPVTVSLGTNRLIRPEHLSSEVNSVLDGDWGTDVEPNRPPYWDGHTAERVVETLRRHTKASGSNAVP